MYTRAYEETNERVASAESTPARAWQTIERGLIDLTLSSGAQPPPPGAACPRVRRPRPRAAQPRAARPPPDRRLRRNAP